MKIVNLSLCTFAALIFCLAPASAQRMPQDYWYQYDTWKLGSGTAYGMTMDTNGLLYVAGGSSDRIHVLDNTGATVFLIGAASGEGHIDNPTGVDLGPDGLLYVIESDDRQVTVYTTGGAYVRSWGSSGSGNGQFMILGNEGGIAVSSDGEVFVADTENHRIQVFDLNGTFLRKWGVRGTAPTEFDYAYDVALDAKGNVYVADYDNDKIKRFLPDGTFVDQVSAFWKPKTVCVSKDGLVFADYDGSIQTRVFDSEFATLETFPNSSGMPRYVDSQGIVYTTSGASITRWRRGYRTMGAAAFKAPPMPYVSRAEQRAGTTWMDVDFTVHDADSSQVIVAALAFVDGGNDFNSLLPVKTFVDNTQTNLGLIPANTERRLTWDVAADWDTTFGQVEVEILARDERAKLLDIEYITIPSNAVAPELTLSRSPLTESDFYNAWLWLIATGDPAIVLTNGMIRGIGGTYDGAYLTDAGGLRALLNPEGEPNDTSGTAVVLAFLQNAAAVEGAMLNSETYDWYAFDVAVSNTVCQMTVAPKAAGSGVVFDTIICYNASMGTVWSWLGNGGSYSSTFTLATPGRYYIRLQRYSTNVEPGTYRLAISLVDGWSGTVEAGRQFLYERLGVREATASEVTRAKEGNLPGTINQWTPRVSIGPDNRPLKVNEYGFDTGDWGSTARWVAPLP